MQSLLSPLFFSIGFVLPAFVLGLAGCRAEPPAFTTSSSSAANSSFNMSSSSSSSSSAGSHGDSTAESSSEGEGGSSSAMTTTTTGEVSTSASATSTDTTFLQDVGSNADLGEAVPEGCQGKIDFLFVLSTSPFLADIQPQLLAAFPKFIDTITTKFENFDYHIMVVDGDPRWGNALCTGACPDLSCKSDDPCCPSKAVPTDLCCTEPNYPCEELELVSECDKTLGAGTVFPAGHMAANKICKLDGGRRYITQDQAELSETFSCIAQVGLTGGDWVGPALVSAVSPELNGPGGCNEGFLREDALLMV
ncbi:MAG TPA: hypothetical protein ENJ50_11865, partial [Planctomycetaceae bacterium]|nr:hypothetical protein [Planctomycetaceae bacterium]